MKDNSFINKIKDAWNKGSIQRRARITYDVAWNIVLFFIILGMMGFFFVGGVGAGYFASLVKDEPIRSYEEMERDIYNLEETSKMYFANEKLIGDIRADLHREKVKLKNVSETLTDAVLATEDELFYEHNGIVPKAIVRAMYQEFSSSETKSGGSTLTQQIIKNQILTNEVSFERKAKEILLAMRLEKFFDKDEILESYINIIPYGRNAAGQNIAGIQTAAKGVFGVDAKDLSLPQAAFLAGIPQNPYAFTPFNQAGEVKDKEGLEPGLKRMKTVLKRMYQTEFITKEEYDEAINYDITKDFTEKAPSSLQNYPALVLEIEKRAKEVITEVLAKEDGYTLDEINGSEELQEQYGILADRALRLNGYEIHSTIDQKMYDAMQKATKEFQYYGPDRTVPATGDVEQVEVGAELIENKTGRILAFVPGRDFRAGDNEINYATGYGTTGRPAGSTFKPIAVYAPAMELGVIQPGSIIPDIPGKSKVNNYGGAFYGLVTAREALTYSYNVSADIIYRKILGENPAKKYLEKMNIPLNKDLQQDASVALGSNNVTVEQNTNAFATLSNGGKFAQAHMIDKITDMDGKVIYQHKVEPVQVFSEQTAYLTIDMMRDVVRSGTGAFIQGKFSRDGVDWAGKTGTSQKYQDAWFVGTNPNVTLGVWLGYNTPSSINNCTNCGGLSYSQRTQSVWLRLVNAATEVNPDLLAPQERHKQPDGIVNRSFCATSGMAPSDLCSKAGLVRSDIFNSKYVPSKTDDSLVSGKSSTERTVKVDGKEVAASAKTPSEFVTGSRSTSGIAFNKAFLERMGYSDPAALIPRRNASAWSKLNLKGATGSSSASSELSDDGSTPSAPSGLSISGNKLSWSKASGQMIVGYRVYHASEAGGSYKAVGHTTGSAVSISGDGGAFQVRAVNYFGRESEPSKTIVLESKKRRG